MAKGEGKQEAAAGEAAGATGLIQPARPFLHLGAYGEPHVGKSHFVATLLLALVGPLKDAAMYVAFFDRRGKHLTYEKVWRKLRGSFTTKAGVDPRGTPYTDYFWKGKRGARIAFYSTPVVTETDGAGRYQSYMPLHEREIAKGKWGVTGIDSVSFMALDARKEDQYVLNPVSGRGNKQHGMQHYGHATDVVEEVLCNTLPNFDCNTFAVMHESKQHVEAEGTLVRSPAVPGKRLITTNMIAATFPELYRVYVERNDDGKKLRRLQTDSDEGFQAGTVIGAPDACRPHYEALWKRWDETQGKPDTDDE